MSKESKALLWDFYEVEVTDALFEWPEPYSIDDHEARVHCEQYLNQLFANGHYTIKNFYFKEKGKV